MKKILCRLTLLLFCCIAVSINKANATHIYGADFTYTYVTGLKYNVTLVIYGDCGGSAISNLYGATPQVEVYNGSSLITTLTLTQQGISTGVEVTPVCPSQLNNTNCVSSTGTVPGVKKFTYTGQYTLSTTSANWKFRFTGSLSTSGGGSTGRSNSISNITTGSIMALEATLNNLSAPNSSPSYTTIPTPFFCINVPANYNPGTIDPDGDNLTYGLVPGLLSTGGTVTYVTPYTATAPLATATSSFSFNTGNGQLAFTPNLVQRSLVVNTVYEYRGSTLVGTSMREMTFVVVNNCSNNAPTGSISSASSGNVSSSGTVLTVCKFPGLLTFNINPTDFEGDTITMSASGVPAGAALGVSSNTTTAPLGSFSWDLTGVAPGSYNFFITYTDNGCPLSSKQTLVYTITVLPQPAVTYALLSAATCSKKAKFNLTPSVTPSPWSINILQGTTTLHTFTGLTTTKLDSLFAGTYTIHVTNANGCYKDTNITIMPPPAVIPAVTMIQPSCYGLSNGSITLYAGGGTSPFTYAIGAGGYTSVSTFSSLAAGTYTLHIKDGFDCIKDTSVVLSQPVQISLTLQVAKPRCNFYSSGLVTLTAANGVIPYQYALGSGTYTSANTFASLPSGTYIFHAKDNNGCIRDSLFSLLDSINVHASAAVTHVLCNPAATGIITITGNSANSPYKYRLGTGTLSSTNTFTGLTAATYNIHVQDVDSCYLDTAINITQPTPITSTSVIINAACKGAANGSITTTAAGGVAPYTYAIGSGTYSSVNSFPNLIAGTYIVHIMDANNCVKDTSIIVTEPAKLIFSNIAIVQPICNNTATGTITITASGGTAAYNYTIDAAAFSSAFVFNGIAAGTYVLHIKDSKACTTDSTIIVAQPTAIVPALSVKQSTCLPLNDGKVTVYATGGVPAYQYAVGSGTYSSTNTFTPLAAGIYTFHIKDTRTCIKDTSIIIVDSTVVTASYVVNNVKCFGESSGSVIATALTGKSPFNYAINTNPVQASGTFTGLVLGGYTIHIKDVLGCAKDTTVNLTQPVLLGADVSVTRPSCYGFANASVLLFGLGGTTPYSFANGTGTYQASGNFTGLTAGNYMFHIKDANNCIHDTAIIITQPTPLVYDSLQITNVLCYGTKTGQVIVFASGATSPYSYTFDGGAFITTPTLTGLGIGTHVIKIKDNNSCTRDTIIQLTQPTKLVMKNPDITYPTCEGYTDASVTLYGTGGTLPYTYAVDVSAYSGDSTFKKLSQGTYKFFLRDANNCVVDTTLTLNGYPPIVIKEIDLLNASCFKFSDGKITVEANGGVPPYTYKFNNGNEVVQNYFEQLAAGTYKIRVIDSKLCFKDTTASITEPEKLVVATKSIPNDCEGYDNSGMVRTDVSGGTYPYNYRWSYPGAGISSDAVGLPNGRYMVWVADANSCTDSSVADVLYDDCCKVMIPNAFTPNGDGKNDLARILFKGDLTISVFMIYNRYGGKMFETSNVNDGWDGMHNGKPQELDTYNYYIKGICGTGGTHNVEYKGTIMLIR